MQEKPSRGLYEWLTLAAGLVGTIVLIASLVVTELDASETSRKIATALVYFESITKMEKFHQENLQKQVEESRRQTTALQGQLQALNRSATETNKLANAEVGVATSTSRYADAQTDLIKEQQKQSSLAFRPLIRLTVETSVENGILTLIVSSLNAGNVTAGYFTNVYSIDDKVVMDTTFPNPDARPGDCEILLVGESAEGGINLDPGESSLGPSRQIPLKSSFFANGSDEITFNLKGCYSFEVEHGTGDKRAYSYLVHVFRDNDSDKYRTRTERDFSGNETLPVDTRGGP